jgi:hypothetical protein
MTKHTEIQDKNKSKSASKSAVGNPNPSTAKKKKKRFLNRRGLTKEQYYQAELKKFEADYQLKRGAIEHSIEAGDLTTAQGQAELTEAAETQNKRIAGAKARRSWPSRKPKTAEERRRLASAAADIRLFLKQTDQNFIALHMLAFANSPETPAPKDLKNIMLVSEYKGNLINKLTSSSKLKPLMSATPHQLSQLTPYFRIFKKSAGGSVEEFEFMDHLKWTYNGPDGVERMLNSLLGQGVGLKSFNWETTGTNLFSAPRTLMATLSLHFQSISELARSARIDEEGKVRWSDLIIPNVESNSIPRGCPTGYPSADTLLNTTLDEATIKKWESDPKSRASTDRDFALLVDVGWKYGVNSDLDDTMKAAVDNSRVTLDLTLVNHRFKFGAEGQIDLEISYVARLDNIMDDYSANLLNLTADGLNNDIQNELQEKKKEIKTLEQAISSPYGVFNCAESPSNSKSQEDKLDKKSKKLREDIDRLTEDAEGIVKRLKVSMYGKFTEHMIKNQKLLHIDVPRDSYARGELPEGRLSNPKGVDAAAAASTQKEGLSLSSPNKDTVASISTKEKDAKEAAVDSKKILNKIQSATAATEPKHELDKRVTYFYLGTLIDFFSGVLPLKDSSEKEVDRFEVVLGDVEFLDYKTIGKDHDPADEFTAIDASSTSPETEQAIAKSKVLDDHRKAIVSNSNYRVKLNMANIPISFDSFTEWFTDEVINKDASVFTFKNFIRSLTTKLLVSALQSASNKYANADIIRVLKESTKVKAGVVGGFNAHLKKYQLNTERQVNGESSLLVSPRAITTDSGDVNKQYFVIYVSRLPFASQEVNEERNAEEGIYHLYLGGDKGIVKSIDLEKEANNRIRDVNIMRAYNVGGNGLGVVQEPYNANVKLFGSGFFQPGQYVYINPTNMGLGTSHERFSIANMLGIGGFYLITKVSTTIKDGDLETNLKCIFQNYGYLPDSPAAKNAGNINTEEVKSKPEDKIGDPTDVWTPPPRRNT